MMRASPPMPRGWATAQLVTDTLAPVLRAHPTAWWLERLEAQKIGCGPINRLSQVFADPQVQARGAVVEMPHGTAGRVKVLANPVRLSETPADYRIPPPLLGEHTEAVSASGSASTPRRWPHCGTRA